MLSTFITIWIYSLCGILGWIFALPIYSPALKQRAIELPAFRRTMLISLFIAVFVLIFSGVAYVNASNNSPFQIHSGNPETNPARYLKHELWLDMMLLPLLAPDAICFTGHETSCQQAATVLEELSAQEIRNIFLTILFSALIPASSSTLLSWYVTRQPPEEEEAE